MNRRVPSAASRGDARTHDRRRNERASNMRKSAWQELARRAEAEKTSAGNCATRAAVGRARGARHRRATAERGHEIDAGEGRRRARHGAASRARAAGARARRFRAGSARARDHTAASGQREAGWARTCSTRPGRAGGDGRPVLMRDERLSTWARRHRRRRLGSTAAARTVRILDNGGADRRALALRSARRRHVPRGTERAETAASAAARRRRARASRARRPAAPAAYTTRRRTRRRLAAKSADAEGVFELDGGRGLRAVNARTRARPRDMAEPARRKSTALRRPSAGSRLAARPGRVAAARRRSGLAATVQAAPDTTARRIPIDRAGSRSSASAAAAPPRWGRRRATVGSTPTTPARRLESATTRCEAGCGNSARCRALQDAFV